MHKFTAGEGSQGVDEWKPFAGEKKKRKDRFAGAAAAAGATDAGDASEWADFSVFSAAASSATDAADSLEPNSHSPTSTGRKYGPFTITLPFSSLKFIFGLHFAIRTEGTGSFMSYENTEVNLEESDFQDLQGPATVDSSGSNGPDSLELKLDLKLDGDDEGSSDA